METLLLSHNYSLGNSEKKILRQIKLSL